MKWIKGDDDSPVITEGQVSDGDPIRPPTSRLPWQRWRKGSKSDDIPFLSSDRRFADDPVTIVRQTHAWRVNVKSGAGVALLVLITNICVLIWANARFELQDGSSTVFSGPCTEMKNIVFWSDLAVNALSTLLLGASNNCAQLLTSPTRKDIDLAHVRGMWLDIGVPSLRNFPVMSRWRKVLIVILFASSIPLHLLYNSVVYSTTSANDYVAALVTEDFITGGYWNETVTLQTDYGVDPATNKTGPAIKQLQNEVSGLTRLENADCIRAFGTTTIVTKWRNVLLVSDFEQPDQSLIQFYSHVIQEGYDDLDWVCNGTAVDRVKCDTASLILDASTWTLNGSQHCVENYTEIYDYGTYNHTYSSLRTCEDPLPFTANVKYCLAQTAEPECTVAISTPLLSVVIVCNVLKIVCMLLTLVHTHFSPLATVGDAIASFMRYPDKTTELRGPLSALDVRRGLWEETEKMSQKREKKGKPRPINNRQWQTEGTLPLSSTAPNTSDTYELLSSQGTQAQITVNAQVWAGKRHRWFRSASIKRWILCIALCLSIWFIGLGLLFAATLAYSNAYGVSITLADIWSQGVGTLNTDNTISTGTSLPLIANVLIANIPQLIVSFVYLFYNNIFTCMLLGAEYTAFAHHRKPLRVSKPVGKQRSTYFLQLPYRYSVPLMTAIGTLHWLIARSIFLVEIYVYDIDGSAMPYDDLNTCGFSTMSIVFALVLGGLMILALVGCGCRRLEGNMPVAGSCSAAISAACHVAPGEDDDAVFEGLRYGAVKEARGVREEMEGGVEHACFSAREVMPLLKGQAYI